MSQRRYRIIAYVCEGGVVHPTNNIGYANDTQVILLNNHDCRYAVVETGGEYRAYDLHEFDVARNFAMTLTAFRSFPTEDAAIMACALTH